MRIDRIERLLAVCQEHLEASDSFGTEIETLLASALLVRIYAEFEQQIQAAVAEKLDSIDDLAARAAFGDLAQVRGIRFRNLSDLFIDLGERYRADWNAKQRQNAEAVTFYGLIIERRHQTAHSAGTTAKLQEVRAWYEAGHIVLDFFRETLWAVDPERLPN